MERRYQPNVWTVDSPVPAEFLTSFVSSPRPGRVPRSAYLSPFDTINNIGRIQFKFGEVRL